MSTRAQIIIKDGYDELWFYRHSDGYPEGVKPTLDRFCEWVNANKIRANVEQAAGWLILLGVKEYDKDYDGPPPFRKKTTKRLFEPGKPGSCAGWKVGAYEPSSPVLHGDIEHLYVILLTGDPNCGGHAKWSEAGFDADAQTWTLGDKTYRTPKTFRSKEIK